MAQRRLPKETIEKVVELLKATNKSNREIAKLTGISHGTVSEIKSDFNINRATAIPKKPKKEIDPTNEKILKLERQVLSLKDERSKLKRQYEAVQRKNTVFQALAEEIKESVTPITPLPKAERIPYSGKKIQESLVMHLSDEHATDVILPHQVGGLENYNFPVALRRGEILVDSTIKFTQRTMKGYDFHTLYILANGDHTSGELHNAVDNSEYRNIFRNCLATGQLHALMIRDLAPYFENVKVIYTPGNHGRKTPKKDHHSPRDNWDYLVAEIAYAYCRDLVNVEFLIPDSFSVNVEIEGWGFHVVHGDDVRSWNSIPFYGLERKTRRLMALNCTTNKSIDYFCFAHFHNAAMQAALRGETLINGSWVATSPFVYNQMSTFTEPTQLIHGVHKERGVSWRLNVKLRTKDELNGPKRYHVILAR